MISLDFIVVKKKWNCLLGQLLAAASQKAQRTPDCSALFVQQYSHLQLGRHRPVQYQLKQLDLLLVSNELIILNLWCQSIYLCFVY